MGHREEFRQVWHTVRRAALKRMNVQILQGGGGRGGWFVPDPPPPPPPTPHTCCGAVPFRITLQNLHIRKRGRGRGGRVPGNVGATGGGGGLPLRSAKIAYILTFRRQVETFVLLFVVSEKNEVKTKSRVPIVGICHTKVVYLHLHLPHSFPLFPLILIPSASPFNLPLSFI